MTHTRDLLVLSGIELIVLARLSSPTPPRPAELTEAVRKLALAESPGRARDTVNSTLASLHQRALVTKAPAGPRRRADTAGRRWILTEDGDRALRAAFDLSHTPTWLEVRDAYLPALGLGLRAGSEEAGQVLKTRDTISAAVLRDHFGIARATTLREVCDALIAETLGLPPGPVTLARIQYHVLARRGGVEPKPRPKKGELGQTAARIAAVALRERRADKRAMMQGLGRRWVYKVSHARNTGMVPPSPTAPASAARPPSAPASPPPVPPVAADTLLTVVRETIPKIGADGRFGPDKVFVSAIWHSIERDRRLLDLSLDRFKRWLVIANRDRLLDLARADLVGAMDPHLVAESEIEHLGATFHCVLDHQAVMPGIERRSHAR
jgi:hypothetical protein